MKWAQTRLWMKCVECWCWQRQFLGKSWRRNPLWIEETLGTRGFTWWICIDIWKGERKLARSMLIGNNSRPLRILSVTRQWFYKQFKRKLRKKRRAHGNNWNIVSLWMNLWFYMSASNTSGWPGHGWTYMRKHWQCSG